MNRLRMAVLGLWLAPLLVASLLAATSAQGQTHATGAASEPALQVSALVPSGCWPAGSQGQLRGRGFDAVRAAVALGVDGEQTLTLGQSTGTGLGLILPAALAPGEYRLQLRTERGSLTVASPLRVCAPARTAPSSPADPGAQQHSAPQTRAPQSTPLQTSPPQSTPWQSSPPEPSPRPALSAPAPQPPARPPGLAASGGFVGAPPANGGGDDHVPDELLLSSANPAALNAVVASLRGQGFTLLQRRELPQLGLVLQRWRVPPNTRAATWQARLQLDAVTVDLNHRYGLLGGGQIPAQQQRLETLLHWQPAGCGSPGAIGLLDTGVARSHPALRDRPLALTRIPLPNTQAAEAHHGTGIAALLLGVDPATGFQGLVPGARLRVADVYQRRQGRAETTALNLLEGLDWLLREPLAVLNLSLGGPHNPLLARAIQGVQQRGVPVVAAAGNGGPPPFPANLPGVVAVAAVDWQGRPWRQGSRGDHVDLAAPGVNWWLPRADQQWHYVSGSSYAAPVVAAALWRNGGDVAALLAAAQDLDAPGPDPVSGHGLVQWPVCAEAD